MYLTTYSSLSFGVLSYITYLANHWMAFPLYILCCTSIIYHGSFGRHFRYRKVVSFIDKVLAHILVLFSAYLALKQKPKITKYLIIYWICFLYIFYIYVIIKITHNSGNLWHKWHATIHIMASIGMLALLFNIYESKYNKKIKIKEIINKI
jgi:hypothetical protein